MCKAASNQWWYATAANVEVDRQVGSVRGTYTKPHIMPLYYNRKITARILKIIHSMIKF